MNLKWKVGEAPTGRYRSFQNRSWPMATFKNCDKIAARIECEKSYTPELGRVTEGLELKVCVADYSVTPWAWRTLKVRATSLAHAKDLAEKFFDSRPDFLPEELK